CVSFLLFQKRGSAGTSRAPVLFAQTISLANSAIYQPRQRAWDATVRIALMDVGLEIRHSQMLISGRSYGREKQYFFHGRIPNVTPLQVIVVKGYRRRRGGSLNKFT